MITPDQVTVVVPTRNEEAGIGRFLASIPERVAVVVVDSSDDSTPELIEQHRPDALVIRASVNIPEARQLGYSAASTPWVIFTDADVVLSNDYFDVLRNVSNSEALGGIVGSKTTVDGFDAYHRWFQRGQVVLGHLGIPAATGSNMIVRRAVLDEIGGFDPDLSVNEDTELMFRVAKFRYRVRVVTRLQVRSFDHRRLELGVARKLVHGTIRNTALYLGVFGGTVRKSDWGYWNSQAQPASDG